MELSGGYGNLALFPAYQMSSQDEAQEVRPCTGDLRQHCCMQERWWMPAILELRRMSQNKRKWDVIQR